jgi:tungstate transport system substrate-binding protein
VDLAAGRGRWYREVGQGMGPALNTAAAMNAYILTDHEWLVSPAGQEAIASYKVNGEQLFFPNAERPEPVS